MQIPLSLPLGPCWELEEGSVDSTTFLQALPSAFREATAAFFEGSSIASISRRSLCNTRIPAHTCHRRRRCGRPAAFCDSAVSLRLRCGRLSAPPRYTTPSPSFLITSFFTLRACRCLSGRMRSRTACGSPLPLQRRVLALSSGHLGLRYKFANYS